MIIELKNKTLLNTYFINYILINKNGNCHIDTSEEPLDIIYSEYLETVDSIIKEDKNFINFNDYGFININNLYKYSFNDISIEYRLLFIKYKSLYEINLNKKLFPKLNSDLAEKLKDNGIETNDTEIIEKINSIEEKINEVNNSIEEKINEVNNSIEEKINEVNNSCVKLTDNQTIYGEKKFNDYVHINKEVLYLGTDSSTESVRICPQVGEKVLYFSNGQFGSNWKNYIIDLEESVYIRNIPRANKNHQPVRLDQLNEVERRVTNLENTINTIETKLSLLLENYNFSANTLENFDENN